MKFKLRYETEEEMPNYVDQLPEEEWESVSGYKKLTQSEKDLLKTIYLRHMNGMGRSYRFEFYGAARIEKVERDIENRSINIFYNDERRTWFHYDQNLTWW